MTNFRLIPAIDLQGGKIVRLEEGDFNRVTTYEPSPESMASQFYELGCRLLHVVDLDGAKAGESQNLEVLKRIRQAFKGIIELGGGIRQEDQVKSLLAAGVDRLVLGTIALKEPEKIKEWLQKYGPEHFVIGIDAKAGKVAVQGWLETSQQSAVDFASQWKGTGISEMIVTNIQNDGMFTGYDLELAKAVASASGVGVIASGGMRNIQDAYLAQNEAETGITGCIMGKAWYDGKITAQEVTDFFYPST